MSKDFTTSIFKYGYARGFRKIGLFFRRIKWAWQRAIKGYCDFDIYDLYAYHANMTIKALREFANKTQSYPNDMEYGEWFHTIVKIADYFEESIEDDGFDTAEHQEYNKLVKQYQTRTENEDGSITVSIPDGIPELNAACEKWLNVIRADLSRREDMKNRAFDLLKQYYWHLWW